LTAPKNSTRKNSNPSALAQILIERIKRGQPGVVGALIHGSAAKRTLIGPGSDLDLLIVAEEEVKSEHVRTHIYGRQADVFCVSAETFADRTKLLSSPHLPFALCDGAILLDPNELLVRARTEISRHLCAKKWRVARARASAGLARKARSVAIQKLATADLSGAQAATVEAIWWPLVYTSASVECRCPTTRRAAALLYAYCESRGLDDLRSQVAAMIRADAATATILEALYPAVNVIGAQYQAGIEAMIRAGESGAVSWPLLVAAHRGQRGSQRRRQAARKIFDALGLGDPARVRSVLDTAEVVSQSLWRQLGTPHAF
jgi:hypothetical protein